MAIMQVFINGEFVDVAVSGDGARQMALYNKIHHDMANNVFYIVDVRYRRLPKYGHASEILVRTRHYGIIVRRFGMRWVCPMRTVAAIRDVKGKTQHFYGTMPGMLYDLFANYNTGGR